MDDDHYGHFCLTTLLTKKCECHSRERVAKCASQNINKPDAPSRILGKTPGKFVGWWDNFLSENHVFYCGTITAPNPSNNVKAQVGAPNCPTRDRATQTAKILKGVGDAVHWSGCLTNKRQRCPINYTDLKSVKDSQQTARSTIQT